MDWQRVTDACSGWRCLVRRVAVVESPIHVCRAVNVLPFVPCA